MKQTRKSSAPDSVDFVELVRTRAYELYEQRGRQDGFDVEDWLTAEQQVQGMHTQRAAA